ncbi:hypothetical protein RHMOL_Rhmol10G0124900 [Rhododendron molle]|uniref:Uncharacterized protein n=1 Tax=Rhododendron molle TaxID=49168 RepID=A0ACC0M2J0_RHOML|nr:hypothetical protein RHMOL_Rhmol10G0124900 [Rhododendron molle]
MKRLFCPYVYIPNNYTHPSLSLQNFAPNPPLSLSFSPPTNSPSPRPSPPTASPLPPTPPSSPPSEPTARTPCTTASPSSPSALSSAPASSPSPVGKPTTTPAPLSPSHTPSLASPANPTPRCWQCLRLPTNHRSLTSKATRTRTSLSMKQGGSLVLPLRTLCVSPQVGPSRPTRLTIRRKNRSGPNPNPFQFS